jgi:capsular exopolysaccharide synthesis family protein
MLSPEPKRFPSGKALKTVADGSPTNNHPPAPPAAPRAPEPAAAAAPAQGFGTLLHAVRHCLPLALALGLFGGTLAAALTWFLAPGRYTASAIVHVSATPPRGTAETDFVAYQRTQAAIVKSPEVIRRALDKPGVAELREVRAQGDPYGWLQKALATDFNAGPELLRVSLSGDNPADLAEVVNAVCKAFVDDCALREEQRVDQRVQQMKASLDKAAKALTDSRERFNKKKDDLHLDNPKVIELRLDNALKAEQAARAKLRETQDQIRDTKAEILRPSDASIDKEIENDPLAKKQFDVFAEQLKKAEEDIAKTNATAKEEYREKALKEPLARKQRALDGVKKVRDDLRPRMEIKVKERLEQVLKALEKKEKDQEGDVERAKTDVSDLEINAARVKGKPLAELKALEDDVTEKESTCKKLSDEVSNLEVERMAGPRVTLRQEAGPPTGRNDRVVKLTAGAGLGTFALVGLGLTWVELRKRRVYESADVARGLGVRVLGSLPPTARPGAALTPAELSALTPGTEAVDGIRTLLLHGQPDDPPRVILVTSAERGEGKTALAAHLAGSLARSWRKTLLIDGDLRGPSAHRVFDLPAEPGFSEALRADADFDAVVRPSSLSRLWLLPAGSCDAHAVQALAQDTLGSAVGQFKDQYDFVVIDAGPVLSTADTLLLAQHADAVLLAARKDVSRVPTVQAARDRLKAVGVPVFGVVVVGEEAGASGMGLSPRA